ncbi:unnamed protein product, partial [Bubo scandiacus]
PITAQVPGTSVALKYQLCLLALIYKANLSIACYNSVKAKLHKKFQYRALLLLHILNKLSPAKKRLQLLKSSSSHNIFSSDDLITNHVCVTAIISIATTYDVIEN